MRLPSASSLERVARCPGSLRLRVVHEESEPAARGSAIHAFLADALAAGRDAALERVPEEHRPACEVIDPALVEMLDPTTMAAEVAYAYSLEMDLGRELGRGLSRDEAYRGRQLGELVGTADLVWLDGEDGVTILDYKSGRGPVAPARVNLQLRALALYAAAAYGRTRARVGIVVTRPGEDARFDMAEFDALELVDVRGQLADIVARAAPENAPFAIGDWCRFCPSFDFCDAQHTLLAVAVATPGALEGQQQDALSKYDRATAYTIWRSVHRLAAKLGDRIGAVASKDTIDLGGGRRYGMVDGPERIADPALVKSVLAEVVSEEAAEAAVTTVTELATTKAAIEKTLKFQKLKPAQREQVFEALRARGAMKASQTLREYGAPDGKGGE